MGSLVSVAKMMNRADVVPTSMAATKPRSLNFEIWAAVYTAP
jgi:hypothetical protein